MDVCTKFFFAYTPLPFPVIMSIAVKNGFLHFSDFKPPRSRSDSCPPARRLSDIQGGELGGELGVEDSCAASSASSFATTPSSHPCTPSIAAFTTTLMVRNIPTRFTSISFLRTLTECGFGDTFDFFYLPMDFRTGKNMGYCFLNFVHENFASMFANIFHGTRLGLTTSMKVLHVSTSRRQGLRENVALFHNSELLSSFSLPFFKPFVRLPMFGPELVPLCETSFSMIMG